MPAQRNSTSNPNRHWQSSAIAWDGLDQAAPLPGSETKRRAARGGGIHDIF